MGRNEQILSLLGLCLRGRNLEVGEEPVEAVSRARDARVILLASDAADNTTRRVKRFAEVGQCVWLRVPFTKEELGQATGRASAAVMAITDIGLAVAVVRRLAEQDPARYDEDLSRLELKAKRAQERKSEAAQHEKNLRRGIKRPKKTAEEQPDKAPSAGESPRNGGKRTGKETDGRSRRSGASAGDHRTGTAERGRGKTAVHKSGSRPNTGAKPNPYAHSRPVKKGKGSFRKKES